MRSPLARAGIILLFLLIALRLGQWRANREEAERLCGWADRAGGVAVWVAGTVQKGAKRPVLNGARVRAGGREVAWKGRIFLSGNVVPGTAGAGAGHLRCGTPSVNPGTLADGLYRWRPLSATFSVSRWEEGTPGPRDRLRTWWRRLLERPFRNEPELRGFVVAVWAGDLSLLPAWLIEQYTEAGLLQLLAASGQHVVCLCVLLLGLARFSIAPLCFFCGPALRRRYAHARLLLPLAAAAWLWATSVDNPPIFRALVMVSVLIFLRWRGLHCGPLQLVSSSAAALILFDPGLVATPGFFLSAAATALLGVLLGGRNREAVKLYFFLSAAMPLSFFPLSAFFFSKVAWAAPLYTIAIGWVWDLIFLPAGFLAPFVAAVLPGPAEEIFVGALAKGWRSALWLHHQALSVGAPYSTVLRPTWAELLLIELGVMMFLLSVKNRVFIRSL